MGVKGIGRTVLGLVAGLTVLGAATPGQSQSGVTVRLFQLTPGEVEVRAGTKVTWTNRDDIAHTVTSGTPERREDRFDAALAGKGATASVELQEPGVYPYFCNRHQSMRGEVRVKESRTRERRTNMKRTVIRLIGGLALAAVTAMGVSPVWAARLNPPTSSTPAARLRAGPNALLSDHVSLAAAATNAALGGRQPEFEAAAAALDANSVDVSKAIGSVYGAEA